MALMFMVMVLAFLTGGSASASSAIAPRGECERNWGSPVGKTRQRGLQFTI